MEPYKGLDLPRCRHVQLVHLCHSLRHSLRRQTLTLMVMMCLCRSPAPARRQPAPPAKVERAIVMSLSPLPRHGAHRYRYLGSNPAEFSHAARRLQCQIALRSCVGGRAVCGRWNAASQSDDVHVPTACSHGRRPSIDPGAHQRPRQWSASQALQLHGDTLPADSAAVG
jgi:hypothetical protein